MTRSSDTRTAQRGVKPRGAIVAELEKDIIFGSLHPHQRLIEDELMERFVATRHTVRRAIDELVRLGLAVHQPNKGAYVRDYTVEEVEELYEIRDVLQTRAIERMELPLPEDTLTQMERRHRQHIDAGDAGRLDKVFRLNNAFHETFFAACGNVSLVDAIRDYAWRTHPVRSRGFVNEDYRQKAQAEHGQIIEAARRGNRQLLIDLNSTHIHRPKELYIRARRLAFA